MKLMRDDLGLLYNPDSDWDMSNYKVALEEWEQ